ncbi:probable 39S ribosomal protein L23, mitochondrial isoform X2 [Mercenaria mercenaria]|uniref:probable 39S ribosomal protein L23, mitochondrial isoform X2 n=1 Tax=Mercenaria mercenaria TaxID=6596 RepID=UPI00234E42C7|nr:probable 39S ribosomal protein L23, mitochondrial isoform X2 [Mercenaria mercenaria]
MNKLDIKQYLEKIYKVPVLSVRTELRTKDIKANTFHKGKITEGRETIWREEEKYAYVQLKKDKFEYPDFFGEGGKTEMTENTLNYEAYEKEQGKVISENTSSVGIPFWFSGRRKPEFKNLKLKKD